MGGFIAPALNYSILAPIITLLAGALIGVLVEAFAPREKRGAIQLPLTLLTLVFALLLVIRNQGREVLSVAGGSVVWDGAG